MSKKDRIFKVLLDRARGEILQEFEKDSCIVSTAICIDVFRHFGIKAEPLPVRALIFNAIAVKCINQFGWPEQETMVEWGKKYGAWSVGIGFPTDPHSKGYVGHLVALVDDKEILDLSLDQGNRPKYKIVLSPLRMPTEEGFMQGKTRLVAVNSAGCLVGYERIANDTYLKSPDWFMRNRRERIVTKLINIINRTK